jgi:hypothetical protein
LSCSDIAKKQELRFEVGRRDLGHEVLEDVELRLESMSLVHVAHVLALPAKRPPGDALDSLRVDAALAKNPELLFAEVVTDHRDHAHGSEPARRDGKERCGPSQSFLHLAVGSLYRIEGNGTDYQE